MAESTKHRSTTEAALIGSVAGIAGGIANATLTHPFDSFMSAVQEEARKGRKFNPGYAWYNAPFHKEMWTGVGHSAFKKGLGFGIGLGTTFAVEAIIKKALDKKNNLTKLGFHKHYDRS